MADEKPPRIMISNLPPELWKAIKKIAIERGCWPSDIVREAIEAYLPKEGS